MTIEYRSLLQRESAPADGLIDTLESTALAVIDLSERLRAERDRARRLFAAAVVVACFWAGVAAWGWLR